MKPSILLVFLQAACSARAERKEHSRFSLSTEERIIQYVDEDQKRASCWLALQKGEEEPVVFWSREAGDNIYWVRNAGVISAADKSGDDIFLRLSAGEFMFFIQANLKTKQERLTVALRDAFDDAFDIMFGGKYKIEAPNRIIGFPGFRNSKNRLLEWREDGKPYLDGEPFFHILSPRVRDGYLGKEVPWAASLSPSPPDMRAPRLRQTEKPAATAWREPFLWLACVLFLLGTGVWFYTRAVRK